MKERQPIAPSFLIDAALAEGRILSLVHTDLNEGGLDAKPLRDDICIKAKSALYLVRYATLSAITPCSPTSISVTLVSPIRGASRQNCRRKHWLPGVRSVRSTGLHVPLVLLKDVPWPNSTS